MPPSVTKHDIQVPFSAKESLGQSQVRLSHDKANCPSEAAATGASSTSPLPNGHAYPVVNGTMAATTTMDGEMPTQLDGSTTLKGRRSGDNSGAVDADDAVASMNRTAGSNAQDGMDTGWRESRPSSASTKPAPTLNGSTIANGGPVLPGPFHQPLPDGPSRASMTMTGTESRPTPSDTPASRHHPSVHRLSSPPIFRTPSPTLGANSTPSSYQSGPPPLRHRHTLQVPRVSSTRTSREYPSPHPSNQSDDVASASGRFSFPANTRRASLTLARRNTRSLHSELQPDQTPQEDDAARLTETLRQKRSSRRRRRDDDDDGRVVMGTKVDQNHVNWVIAYNMLTGIRFVVSRTNAKLNRDLTDEDFNARIKFSFDM